MSEHPAQVSPVPKGNVKPAFEGRFALPAGLQAQADARSVPPPPKEILPGSFADLLKHAIDDSGLSVKVVAGLCKVTDQTIRNWLLGSEPMKSKQSRSLEAIEQASPDRPAGATVPVPPAPPQPPAPKEKPVKAKGKPGRPKKVPSIQQANVNQVPVKQVDAVFLEPKIVPTAKTIEVDLSVAETVKPEPVAGAVVLPKQIVLPGPRGQGRYGPVPVGVARQPLPGQAVAGRGLQDRSGVARVAG